MQRMSFRVYTEAITAELASTRLCVLSFGLSSEIKSLVPVYSVVKMQQREELRLGVVF